MDMGDVLLKLAAYGWVFVCGAVFGAALLPDWLARHNMLGFGRPKSEPTGARVDINDIPGIPDELVGPIRTIVGYRWGMFQAHLDAMDRAAAGVPPRTLFSAGFASGFVCALVGDDPDVHQAQASVMGYSATVSRGPGPRLQ